MCRNIRVLFNFDPPASRAEVEAAALQYVRKVSGSTRPSLRNQPAFDRAVADITRSTLTLLAGLSTVAPPKSREEEAEKARKRNQSRFAGAGSRTGGDAPG